MQSTKFRRRLLLVILIVFLLAGVLTITKYFIAPAFITNSITSKIEENWPGEVRLKGLKFYYRGRITFDELICLDDKQRNVINIKDVKVFLPRLLLFEPKVKNIQIASAEFDLFGPLKSGGGIPDLSEIFDLLTQGYLDINKLDINNISITLHGTEKEQLAFEDLSLNIIRRNLQYEIEFKSDPEKESRSFNLDGVYDTQTGKTQFEISMDQSIQAEQAAIIANLLGVDESYLVKGSLSSEFKISQPPKETDIISLDGFVEFEDWNLIFDQNDLVKNLQTKLIVEDKSLTVDNFSGEFCRGTIEGRLEIQDWKDIYNCFWKGNISGRDIDLSVLNESVTLPRKIKRGKLSFEYMFTGKGDGFIKSLGEGSVALNKSDLYKLPLITQLFNVTGSKLSKARKSADAWLEFRKEGSIVVINSGRITNPVWAVKIEPGGKIDLVKQTYDIHVVFVPLSQIDEALNIIPITEILVNLKDHLTKFRIRGNLAQPEDNELKEEKLTDVKDPDTAGFVRDLLESESKSD